jgi:hypothetical protein
MALFPLGILSAAGAGGVQGDYELIESRILATATSEVVFSSLATYASTYKHLQIRYVSRNSGTQPGVFTKLNGDSSSVYRTHYLLGDGSSVSSNAFAEGTQSQIGLQATSASAANDFRPGVIDLLDPYSTTKNKTLRALSASSGAIILMSVLYRSTSSITEWQLIADSGNFVVGSRFSIYGIKG